MQCKNVLNDFLELLLTKISSYGRVYMKNSSYTEGMVVVDVNNQFYNILFEQADLHNMTIKIRTVDKMQVIDSETIR